MSLDLYWRLLLALVFVVALIAVFAWLARRFGFAGRAAAGRAGRRLAVLETAPLDAKRRLVLVRRDDTEHLILVGGESALLIEGGIRRAPEAATPNFAATLRETGT